MQLPSPCEALLELQGVQIWLKRDDLIHPQVSGNKWRKLRYYWQDFEQSTKQEVLSFGGAFSNHLAALAAAGKHLQIPTRALVRGEELQHNPTLDFCRAQGMELEFITRAAYREKDEPGFIAQLQESYPQSYIIPEGGKGSLGIKGCTEILKEVNEPFDWVCASLGTGTTASGLLLSAYPTQFLFFSALKDQGYLKQTLTQNVESLGENYGLSPTEVTRRLANFEVNADFHFGGYAKVTDELIEFMNTFFEKTGVKLDPVYTGKMLFGIYQLIHANYFQPGTRILALHSGGLQGISGMNQKLKKQHKRTIIYEA